MQSLIILAASLCLAKASYYAGPPAHIQLSPDGKYVLDTPEVAHAKAAHYAAHAQASTHHGAWAPALGGAWAGGPAGYAAGHYGAPAAGLHKYGPAPLAHDGRVVDTPEVAHLKAAHLQAHAAASHGGHAIAPLGYAHGPAPIAHGLGYAGGYAGGYGKWTGPPAHIQLTHDGQYVVDTPEVQHARAAHLAQYAHAAAAAAAAPEEPWGHGPHGHGSW
ncbi:pupal cuticle protein-like [Hyposmocoma kahamanoa]|uniref:pupal cuticle protein-like n=1 Tax=Hyposmocoma kahamanoa TaxID=1477025 RepID=UPI000E6D72C9|nr:pupal cuticle protein-like [Hyposmocoma kahamanoa]